MMSKKSWPAVGICPDWLDATLDRIWVVDTSYCLVYANKGFLEQSMKCHKFPLETGDNVLNWDFPISVKKQWKQAYDRVLLTGDSFKQEIGSDYQPDKKNHEYAFSPVREKDGKIQGVLVIGRDITQRKILEEKLSASELKFRGLVEQAAEMLFLHDPEGRILDVNQAAIDHTGYSREELLSMKVWDIDPDVEKRRDEKNIWNGNEPIEPVTRQVRHQRKDGSIYPAEVTIGKIVYPEKTLLLGLARDITERKETAAKLKKVIAEQDRFFSILGHDLRGPFHVFLGFTDLMAGDIQRFSMEELQDMASRMKRSATSLMGLLENLLEWSRLRGREEELQICSIDLKKAISDSVYLYQESIIAKKLKIVDEYDHSLPLEVNLNLFETLLRNLLSNAIKFTPEGGIITISTRKTRNNQLVIQVADTGIGMSEEWLDDLFQIDKPTRRLGTNEEPSSGLGLILCHEIVKKHQGTLRIDSREGKGTTVEVFLPVHQQDDKTNDA